MVPHLVVMLLAASANPVSVAATDFSLVGGVSRETASFVNEHFAQRLAEFSGAAVTTSKNIAAVIGIERQRELLGCTDGGSACLAELAGALGAQAIIVGELAKLEHSLQLNVRIVDGKSAKVIFFATARGATTEELIDRVDGVAREAAQKLSDAFPESHASGAESGVRWGPPVVGGLGALVVAVGAGFGIASVMEHGRLGTPRADLSPQAAEGVGSRAAMFGTASIVMLVAGAAVAAAGIAWGIFGSRAQVTATVAPTGGAVFFQAPWP